MHLKSTGEQRVLVLQGGLIEPPTPHKGHNIHAQCIGLASALAYASFPTKLSTAIFEGAQARTCGS